MSEELTLLGGSFTGSELWVACGNMRKCRMAGPSRKTVAEAVAAWNAMPRDLTWTDEPPKEVGNYWWRWDAGSKHWIYNVRLIPTIHGLITYDHSAYDAEHVEDIGGQWAGPIPEPREPKEQGGYDG